LVGRLLEEGNRRGHIDLEAGETAIRSTMLGLGGSLLEKVVNADHGGYAGPEIECEVGHRARFVDYRRKTLTTVLAKVEVSRAYYHCARCGAGTIPKDKDLDISGTSLSPGVRRMIGRVGSKEPFDEARGDLEDLAGVAVLTKEVERVSEAIGEQIDASYKTERAGLLEGTVISLESPLTLYIVIDATGVPVVRRESEGRKGKSEGGLSKTREAKLAAIFTQTRLDEKGRPVRDEASTSYVGEIETAAEFGFRVYGEALRRGLLRALRVIVLGDGAPWIWAIADLHFPGAIQIVDLYHARQHLSVVAKTVYGTNEKRINDWTEARKVQLDAGQINAIITAMKRLRPKDVNAYRVIQREIAYFRTNAERMRYAEFRRLGLFVGSGVVEAGCKTVIGRRLKQSGMHWTVNGANKIIALRCCYMSGRWEDFWEARALA
jgi:hypothetical protein